MVNAQNRKDFSKSFTILWVSRHYIRSQIAQRDDMLLTNQLKFRYPEGNSFEFPDIRCKNNEHLLILGESGKGKTTLLHLLAGMLKPTSGEVVINDTKTSTLAGSAMDKFRGNEIGIIFQTAHFVESLSVLDNLILPQYLSGKATDCEKAKSILARLNLADKANVKPKKLSVGEQQRVAIARAIINHPSIILADEPTSALDDVNTNEVINLLEEQAKLTGASLIIVTHDKRLKDRFSKQVTL